MKWCSVCQNFQRETERKMKEEREQRESRQNELAQEKLIQEARLKYGPPQYLVNAERTYEFQVEMLSGSYAMQFLKENPSFLHEQEKVMVLYKILVYERPFFQTRL